VGNVDGLFAEAGQVGLDATGSADLGDAGTGTGRQAGDGLAVGQRSDGNDGNEEFHRRRQQDQDVCFK
jgi:hypothetical protein